MDAKVSTDGLTKLMKALKKMPTIKVGVLGDGNARNATIGAIHEFGGTKMPQRSFLRIPISEHLDARLQKAGLLDKKALAKIIRIGNMVEPAKKIGIIAEGIVIEAFETGGFGAWKPSDMKNKKVHMTLVETQQLRNSITSEVEIKT